VHAVQIGLVGSGNMARAMARGWQRPVLCTASRPERAQALADEVGGEAVGSNAELAQRVDVVVLAHKDYQLTEVAAEVAPHARRIASVLGGTSVEDLRAAYPGIPVHRFMPNTPVAVRAGVIAHAAGPDDDPEVLDLFRELGSVVTVRDDQIGAAAGLMGCSPAYWALVVEAQVDAGVRAGIPGDVASEMVVQTMAGSAALLAADGPDTLAMRRAVTSPGGSTARGLAALERGGVRAAFSDAMDAVLGR
jgi:pyrroline-5-carboxylate reductase